MKTIGYIFAAAVALSPIAGNASTIESPRVTSVYHIKGRDIETRELAKFSGIRIVGSADVFLTQDGKQQVQVDAEANTASHVMTTVEDDVLVIKTEDMQGKGVKVYVTVPDVREIAIEGSGNLIGLTPVHSENLALSISGSGNISLNVDAQKTVSAIFGSGNIDVIGKTNTSQITLDGSGDFHGRKLVSNDVTVTSSGSGDAEVHASRSLRVDLAGSGDVRYIGEEAKVLSHLSGSGSVRKLPKSEA